MLLADCFENFRELFLKEHEIDPCYYYSAPGLTWDCGLRYAGKNWNDANELYKTKSLQLLDNIKNKSTINKFNKAVKNKFNEADIELIREKLT